MVKVINIPNVTTVQRDALVSPANGSMVYNTDDLEMQFTADSGTSWQTLGSSITDSIADGITYQSSGSSGVSGTPTMVSSFESRIGNVVTAATTFVFTSSLTSIVINLNKSYGGIFSSAAQASGTGLIYRISGASETDGQVAVLQTDLGNPYINLLVNVSTSGPAYYIQLSFCYLVTP